MSPIDVTILRHQVGNSRERLAGLVESFEEQLPSLRQDLRTIVLRQDRAEVQLAAYRVTESLRVLGARYSLLGERIESEVTRGALEIAGILASLLENEVTLILPELHSAIDSRR